MFHIHRVYDDTTPADKEAITKIQQRKVTVEVLPIVTLGGAGVTIGRTFEWAFTLAI